MTNLNLYLDRAKEMNKLRKIKDVSETEITSETYEDFVADSKILNDVIKLYEKLGSLKKRETKKELNELENEMDIIIEKIIEYENNHGITRHLDELDQKLTILKYLKKE